MSDALGDYLKTIGRIPLLTDAEEVHLGTLVREWQDGVNPKPGVVRRGRRAHNRMVNANLRLVVTIVSRYARRSQHLNQDAMDMIQAGNIGLIRAVEKFDPSRGYKFSTYGYWWIKQAVGRYLHEHSSSIRLPVSVTDLAVKAGQLQAASEEMLSQAEIATKLGQSERRLKFVLHTAERCHIQSLDQQVGGNGQDMTLIDTIASCEGPSIEDDYQWMYRHIGNLDAMERRVLRLRFVSENKPSLAKVSIVLGLSKDKVQRIERNALAKLRRRLEPSLNPEYSRFEEDSRTRI